MILSVVIGSDACVSHFPQYAVYVNTQFAIKTERIEDSFWMHVWEKERNHSRRFKENTRKFAWLDTKRVQQTEIIDDIHFWHVQHSTQFFYNYLQWLSIDWLCRSHNVSPIHLIFSMKNQKRESEGRKKNTVNNLNGVY